MIFRKAISPSPRILLLDNYDSFTYNLYDYLLQSGAVCDVIRNDVIDTEDVKARGYDAIVLSPGPGRPDQAGIMPALIAQTYASLPILGICLGQQAIGEFFGARLVHASAPVHGKTSMVTQQGHHPLFEGLPEQFEVMRYHSLILDDLAGTPLYCIAHTQAGEIMAIAHRRFPLTGVQFHPESILTEYGRQMIDNWVNGICMSG